MDISTLYFPTHLHAGVGAHEKIRDILGQMQAARVFIALDAALKETDFARRIQALLAAGGMNASIFTDIEPDPSDRTVGAAYDLCKWHDASAILAIGGGSTMDVAKAVGILMTNGGRIHDYEGNDKFSNPPLPLIAIPTTAGTGSEVSGSCVITDTKRTVKMSIRHQALNPAAHAILDPLGLRTMPPHVAVHSGIDAFVHAFESYINRRASVFTDALNIQALELLATNIRDFVTDRGNLQSGLNMLCGSALAGICFSHTGTGNIHCIARFVGARYHCSHGLSNALLLPAVARFNAEAAPAKYRRVALAMGCEITGMSDSEAAEAAVTAIEQMCRDLGIPAGLREVGVPREDFELLAEMCSQGNYNTWNPRTTSRGDFKDILQQAY